MHFDRAFLTSSAQETNVDPLTVLRLLRKNRHQILIQYFEEEIPDDCNRRIEFKVTV